MNFVIAGDGNKLLLLTEMVERNLLSERVTLLGGLPNSAVPALLRDADIMLNTSLTESFCIAVLEAACCGCVVVSSDVGGVREVFCGTDIEREGGVFYADVSGEGMERGVGEAVGKVREMRKGGGEAVARTKAGWHADLAEKYTWGNVALKTEAVYRECVAECRPRTLPEHVRRWAEGRSLVAGAVAVAFGLWVWAFVAAVERWGGEVQPAWNVRERELLRRKKNK